MKLVILDRNGVITQDPEDGTQIKGCTPIPHSLHAIARLNQAGYRVMVASNEPEIVAGSPDIDNLTQCYAELHQLLAKVGAHISGLFFCRHDRQSGCACRKPQAGLYEQIALRLGVELTDVPVIGDELSDLQPAVAIGARPILVLTGKGASQQAKVLAEIPATAVYANLAEATAGLLLEETP